MRPRPRTLLADEPGLGKSRQILMVAKEPVLILAPAMVLDGKVWDDEIEKWASGIDATQATYHGIREGRKGPKGGIVPLGVPKDEYRKQWGTIVLDESHYIKNRDTTWTEAIQMLRAGEWRLATGTPIPNWAYELFTTLQTLYPERSAPGQDLGSYWRWVRKWFKTWKPHYAPRSIEIGGLKKCTPACKAKGTCEHWAEFYAGTVGDLMLRRLRSDVLDDLPPLVEQTVLVPMMDTQARFYRSLKRDYVAWVEETGTEVIAWSGGGLHTKLRQVASGVGLVDRSDDPHLGSAKMRRLEADLRDRSQPTLVVAHHQRAVDACGIVATKKAKKRAAVIHGGTGRPVRRRIVEQFKAGDLDVLCASIDVIREGLTLTRADCVIMVEHSWRPDRNEQVMRRIHRIGQERPCTVLHYVTPRTVDEGMLKQVGEKTEEQLRFYTAKEFAKLL